MEQNKNSNNKLNKIIIILSIIIAAFSFYMLVYVELPNKPLAGKGDSFAGNAAIGGDFVLTDYNGNKFSSENLKGKLSLIYFGFTYCPDICPTTLQKLTNVLSVLDKYQIDVNPVFITIDPNRDKAALIKEYLGHFHPKFIGLTGSEEEVRKTANLFKVYYAKSQDPSYTGGNYMVDHSSFIYLMDKNGKYMKHFYFSTTPEEIVEYIRLNKG